MTMPLLLLVASTLAVGVSAAVPVLEQQFFATVRYSNYHDGVLFSESEYDMYYDTPNQRYRQTFLVNGSNRTMVANYKTNVGFMVYQGVCTLLPPPPHAPAMQTIDPRAVDMGKTTVSGGEGAILWRAIYQVRIRHY